MDATEASTYNTVVDWYKGRGHWFSPPMVQYVDGKPTVQSTPPDEWPKLPSSVNATSAADHSWSLAFESISDVYDVEARSSSPLAEYYRSHIRSTLQQLVSEGRQFGALVMEPVCLGAGGMVFVDPLFQKILIEVVRSSADLFGIAPSTQSPAVAERLTSASSSDEWQGLPVIYDEGGLLLLSRDVHSSQSSRVFIDSGTTRQPRYLVTRLTLRCMQRSSQEAFCPYRRLSHLKAFLPVSFPIKRSMHSCTAIVTLQTPSAAP